MTSGPKKTVIDVIERTIGPLDPDTIVSVERISLDKVVELKHEYSKYRKAYLPPIRRPGELRPYVPIPYMSEMAGGLSPAITPDLRKIVDPEQSIDRVHLHLMYAHSIALPDPLLWILDFIPSDKTLEDERVIFLERLRNYLIYINYMRPLIEGDIVILAPSDLYTPMDMSGDFTRLRFKIADKVRQQGDFSDLILDKPGLRDLSDPIPRIAR